MAISYIAGGSFNYGKHEGDNGSPIEAGWQIVGASCLEDFDATLQAHGQMGICLLMLVENMRFTRRRFLKPIRMISGNDLLNSEKSCNGFDKMY